MVKKQERFFDLSHKLLWIRSPALTGSLERSSLSYLEAQTTSDLFFLPSDTLPFGIDLIWRTHRLYLEQYWLFRRDSSGLAPPDQMTEPRLQAAGKKPSSPQPRNTTCACWTCERIRDDVLSFTLPPEEAPPYQSSALPTAKTWNTASLSSLSTDQLRSIQDDLGFCQAVQNARERGLPLPTRAQTSKEKEAGKREQQRREEVGRLPGLNEYVEIGRDGKRTIKVSKGRSTYWTSIV